MFIWRLVFEKVATLEELETVWNYDDALRAHALLDMREAMSQQQLRDAKKRK